eukprot:6038692-Alexandrium_andersonii.AAC.1
MSASLVGSEMCIRDSSTARPAVTSTRAGYAAPAARAAARPHAWLLTVSYTHLTLPTICSV